MYSEQQATISKRGRADLFWKYDLDYLPEIAKTSETGFDYGKDTGLKASHSFLMMISYKKLGLRFIYYNFWNYNSQAIFITLFIFSLV